MRRNKRKSGAYPRNGEPFLPFTFVARCVDLFCGAGGLSLGLKLAGFHLICAVDSRDVAVRTYRQNLGDHVRQERITEDIDLPDADVIVGGPPC
jgi:DNA (cytosine-5)-methyltransferase 1